ncbi:MAG: DUF1552 domain-containing protein [Myxococcota bacterium]
MLIRTTVSRRALLRGFGYGAAAAAMGPLLRQLLGQHPRSAYAAETRAPPKRVVFMVEGNGHLPNECPIDLLDSNGRRPRGSAELLNRTFTQLPDSLAALEDYRDRMAIIYGPYHGWASGHWGLYQGLTCLPGGTEESPTGPTIDRYMASRIGIGYPMRHLPIAVTKDSGRVGVTRISADGVGKPVPMRASVPDTASLLFGATNAEEVASVTRSGYLIDFLKDDVARVEGLLSGNERIRAQQYVSTLESVSNRVGNLKAHRERNPSCGRPESLESYNLGNAEDRMEAMTDITAATLACGITPVATLSFMTGSDFEFGYKRLGYTIGGHTLGHGGVDPTMGDTTFLRNYHAGLVARLANALSQYQDIDGSTVFDNTVIVMFNANGSSHHNRGWYPWKINLIGDAGGSLAADGRYLRSWEAPNRKSVPPEGYVGLADIWSTLARAVGALPEEENHWQPASLHKPRGVVSELLT